MNRKFLRSVPFAIICIILFTTWYKFSIHEYFPIREHYWALGFAVLNLIIYFIKFKYGVLFTGIVIVLGIFGILIFYPLKMLSNYGITIGAFDINTPYMEMSFWLILFLYLGINARYIWAIYHSYTNRLKQ